MPFLPSASRTEGQGFVRVVNRSGSAGEVSIAAIDDAGQRFGPLTLPIGRRAAVHFDAEDLQYGNEAIGLPEGVGLPTEGDWRLVLTSALDTRVLAYARSGDAVPASLHERAPKSAGVRRVAMFNPAGTAQASLLRLVNPGEEPATVTIRGVDDGGAFAAAAVRTTLPAGAARTLTADDLESGSAATEGAFGDGSGRWRLALRSDRPIRAVHLLAGSGGLANLSTAPAASSRDASGSATHRIPYFPEEPNGLGRFVNESNRAGTVEVRAFDQTGRALAPTSLAVGARQAVHFNSADLALDEGTGPWRLALSTNLMGHASAYFRSMDGLLIDLQAAVPDNPTSNAEGGVSTRVFFFGDDDATRRSLLRLVNWSAEDVTVTIAGRDDLGQRGASDVRLVVAAGQTRTIDAAQLESGGDGLSGALGDGSGSWRLVVESTAALDVLSLLESDGRVANLSSVPRPEDASASGIFAEHISSIVQSQCVACHVAGGRAARARLLFTTASAADDHEARNLQAIQRFIEEVEDGAGVLLNRIQGIGHGGGVQVAANTEDHIHMARLLTRLSETPVPDVPSATALFDGVRLESPASTLRRAALLFAGRAPTAAEYSSVEDGSLASLRRAVRGLMVGAGFHEFLLRSSNDRLLTDRELARFSVIGNDGFFVNFDDDYVRLRQADDGSFLRWHRRVQYGAGRAPLELIAHVAENDLPYTTVLTADYIMANPDAAAAYGAATAFDDPNDVHEFKPSAIVRYHRHGTGYRQRYIPGIGVRVVDPGPLATVHPQAGVLNTKAFLQRYPSTATNRNRARARWTYYHFLGLDVEKSASRTTDPDALADTDNPTLKNPACTVCHQQLDPVAGAFQNYGDSGYYRDQWGGLDSLDYFYKHGADSAQAIRGASWPRRSTLAWTLRLPAGPSTIGFAYTNDFYDEETEYDSRIFVDSLRVVDADGREIARHEFEDAPPRSDDGDCGEVRLNPATNERDHLQLWQGGHECAVHVQVEAPRAGEYAVEVVAWGPDHEGYGGDGHPEVSVVADPYRLGDTWFRDMREPGFRGVTLPDSDDSLAWLARRIVAADDFATATVKFWWPAVMGSEVAEPVETDADADFQGRQLAATAQQAEVQRLADGFRDGFGGGFGNGSAYNLKDLLTELALSEWFRADSVVALDEARSVALLHAGAKRLLTPEELSRKTAALTGFEWGRWHHPANKPHRQHLAALTDERGHRLLYGGIDSDGITERSRDLTSVMAGVAQAHAAQVSCPVVLRELYLLPSGERRLFGGVEAEMSPLFEMGAAFEATDAKATYTLRGELNAGRKRVFLKFPNDFYESGRDRNLFLDRLDVRNAAGDIVQSVELETLAAQDDCNGPQEDHYALYCNGWAQASLAVETAGDYTLEIIAWADLHGSEAPRLDVVVESETPNAVGVDAIKRTLVALHEKLLGIALDIEDEDIATAYQLFVEVWQRKRANAEHAGPWFFPDRTSDHASGRACYWTNDIRFLDGLVANPVGERRDPEGRPYRDWQWANVNPFWDGVDTADPHFAARTWVVVLAYLLTDYRYLHL